MFWGVYGAIPTWRRNRSPIGIILIVGLAGCGGGGGGGGGIAPPVASATSLEVTPGIDGTTELTFEILDPAGSAQIVEIEFSADRGLSYAATALVGLDGNSFTAPPGGGTYQLQWSHGDDLEIPEQSDLRLRVTPREASTGRLGGAAVSAVFGIGANTPPTIVSVTTPVGIQGGLIEFPVVIADAESDYIEILIEYSLDGGSSWQVGTSGPGNAAVPSSPTGSAQVASWNATVDENDTVSTLAQVRMTAVDIETGGIADTAIFSVQLIDPEIEALTLGAIPNSMNGSTPYAVPGGLSAFMLRVPTYGFALSIETEPGPGGASVDPATLEVTCNRDLGSALAGTDLSTLFSGDDDGQSAVLPASHALPIGVSVFSARVRDVYGNISTWATIALESNPGTSGNLPFDWLDRWWIDFGMDQFAITASGTSSVSVVVTPGANGTPDHIEDLRICGLQSENPLAACVAIGTNARVRGWAEQEVVGRLREAYGADFDGDTAGFAPNLEFTLEQAGSTSGIRIGGDDVEPGFALGRAFFDARNAGPNMNRGPNLGVFSTNLIQFYVNTYYFRQRFQTLMPGIGTPVGEDSWDVIVLDPNFDRFSPTNHVVANYRYDAIWNAIEAWGRANAVIAAHEIGHSIGLCANGPPPFGLFGGVTSASFSGPYTSSFHLDTPGNNLMASALSFSSSLITGSSGYRFNELNEAYLRHWTLLGN